MGSYRGRFRVPFVWWRVFQVPMHDPPYPLYRYVLWGVRSCLGFSRNGLGFYLESDRIGGVFGFLLSIGVVFTGGCMTPPSPFFGGVLGFLFVGGVLDSLNWDIFSYFFVLFFIYLGYECAVVVRRRQVRIFVDWFFAGSPPRACESLRC